MRQEARPSANKPLFEVTSTNPRILLAHTCRRTSTCNVRSIKRSYNPCIDHAPLKFPDFWGLRESTVISRKSRNSINCLPEIYDLSPFPLFPPRWVNGCLGSCAGVANLPRTKCCQGYEGFVRHPSKLRFSIKIETKTSERKAHKVSLMIPAREPEQEYGKWPQHKIPNRETLMGNKSYILW